MFTWNGKWWKKLVFFVVCALASVIFLPCVIPCLVQIVTSIVQSSIMLQGNMEGKNSEKVMLIKEQSDQNAKDMLKQYKKLRKVEVEL